MKAHFKRFTLYYIFLLILLVFTYTQYRILSNIVYLTMLLLCGYKILRCRSMHIHFKKMSLLIGSAAFWLAFTNFINMSLKMMSSDSLKNYPLIMIMYFLVNVLLAFSLIIHIINRSKLWNKVQLALDFLLFATIAFGIMFATVFMKIDYGTLTLEQLFYFILYLSFDMIMIVIILTVSLSDETSVKSRFIIVLSSGVLLYIISDFIYIRAIYNNLQIAPIIAPICLVLSFYLFTYALCIDPFKKSAKENELIRSEQYVVPENFGHFGTVWLVVLIPIILLFLGYLSMVHIVMSLIVIAVYQIISYSLQKTTVIDLLYAREIELKQDLEQRILEKTQALIQANEILEIKGKVDSLTGLYNRTYFYSTVDQLINEHAVFSIVYLDLNRFKIVNDLHGRIMGDEVLKALSKRFNETAFNPFISARTGGDEFAFIYMETRVEQLTKLCLNLIEHVICPFEIEGYKFQIDASIGVSRHPLDAEETDDLLKCANVAMHYAKSLYNTDKYSVYSDVLIAKDKRRNAIELLLRSADIQRDFELYFQPIIDTNSEEVVACEALLRWFHAEEGFISPAEFIPVAEDIGMIALLSQWVFKQAMLQIKMWNTTYFRNIQVGINLSPMILNQVDFLQSVKQLLDDVGVNPQNIDFEITEHMAMASSTFLEETLVSLSNLGVSISIDDFGTGYSSLSYIKRFEIDTLKIAKELIDNIANEEDMLIVKAIILMAKGLELNTVAEGVETQEQFDILKQLGCNNIQGYIYGKPVSVHVFEQMYLKGEKIS